MTTFPPRFVEFDYKAYMCALSLAELCGTSFMHEVKYRYIFYVCCVCVYIHICILPQWCSDIFAVGLYGSFYAKVFCRI